MRISNLLTLVLPTLACAQAQVPFIDNAKLWLDKAQTYLQSNFAPSGVESAPGLNEHGVQPLTLDNWRSIIQHTGKIRQYNPPEPWMIYITGGNKTCAGRCGLADKAWNESAILLQSDISAPHLASVNCDQQEVLCGVWAAHIPSVFLFLVPQPMPDQSSRDTPLHIFDVNMTTVTNADITRIHTRKLYLDPENPAYTGSMHPIDGWIAKSGLQMPIAYVLWGLAKIPSWAFMIGISMFSRQFMYVVSNNLSSSLLPR